MKDSNTDNIPNDEVIPQYDASQSSLKIDYELYQHYLDESDLSEVEKQEFLDTLWSIIVSFVDLGFGVHPVQQVCGEKLSLDEILISSGNPVVERNKQSENKTNNENASLNSLVQERSPE